jgi:hypothetical protein
MPEAQTADVGTQQTILDAVLSEAAEPAIGEVQ